MLKLLRALIFTVFGAAVLGGGLLGATYAFPAPLFDHVFHHGRITIRSDHPVPDSARPVIDDIERRLATSPLGDGAAPARETMPMGLYVVNTEWRRKLFWNVTSETAGGFVVIPFSRRHAFLNAADFDKGLLVLPIYGVIEPPRVLAYYGAHELTHVETADRVGMFRFYAMPEWVREGLADYVGFGAGDTFEPLYQSIGGRTDRLKLAKDHGWYAIYRLLVAYFLEVEGWTIDQLLATDLPEPQARARMIAHVEGRNL